MIAASSAAPALTLTRVAQLVHGDLVVRQVPRDASAREAFLRTAIEGASIDTRALEPGQLFVPLRGEHADGHDFLDEAFRRGAAAALCERSRHAALAGRSLDVARLLLEAGADPNAAEHGGYAPLHQAAEPGDLPLIRLLLDRGARTDRKDDQGRTPLDLAEAGGHTLAVDMLRRAASTPAS